jgi:hypothetical protein
LWQLENAGLRQFQHSSSICNWLFPAKRWRAKVEDDQPESEPAFLRIQKANKHSALLNKE